MLAVALCGYAGFGLLLSLGQETVPAGTTSLLLNISPVFAFVLGYFVLVERTTTLGYLGMLIAVVGVLAITVGDGSAAGFRGNTLLIVVPLISLLLGWVLLGEVPSLAAILGGAAALIGVAMLSRATSRRKMAGPGLLAGAVPGQTAAP